MYSVSNDKGYAMKSSVGCSCLKLNTLYELMQECVKCKREFW